MHELTIAAELIEHVEQIAYDNGVSKVEGVVVEAGVMKQVVGEALEAAFSELAEGTVAAGAKLTFVEVPALAECRSCGSEFTPEIGFYVCPECGRADARIVSGDEIILKTLECVEE